MREGRRRGWRKGSEGVTSRDMLSVSLLLLLLLLLLEHSLIII
jgi:hypothetical protein